MNIQNKPNKLSVIATEKSNSNSQGRPKISKRQEAASKFDELWDNSPKKFDCHRNCMEKERLKRTLELILEYENLKGKLALDLGSGNGNFSMMLYDEGAKVHAVDISENALKQLREKKIPDIEPIQDFIPKTQLKDRFYDLVVSTDLIAELPKNDYRLYFSELARLVKTNGYVVCSTPLDIDSEGPLQIFASLAESEFEIIKWKFSYHTYFIRLKRAFKSPTEFIKAWKDKKYREKKIKTKRGIAKWWFSLNSLAIPAMFWSLIRPLSQSIVSLMDRNSFILLQLEKICRFIKDEAGISHAIFIAKIKPLSPPLPKSEQPLELKHKRQVWE